MPEAVNDKDQEPGKSNPAPSDRESPDHIFTRYEAQLDSEIAKLREDLDDRVEDQQTKTWWDSPQAEEIGETIKDSLGGLGREVGDALARGPKSEPRPSRFLSPRGSIPAPRAAPPQIVVPSEPAPPPSVMPAAPPQNRDPFADLPLIDYRNGKEIKRS